MERKNQKKMRKKMSINSSGKNNPMYGKPPSKSSGSGIGGQYKGFYFRSLLELSYILFLEKNNVSYSTAEIKKYRVFYKFNGVSKTYSPDLVLQDGTIREIKPYKLTKIPLNKAKFKAARKKYGGRFKVVCEKDFPFIKKEELLNLQRQHLVTLTRNSKRINLCL